MNFYELIRYFRTSVYPTVSPSSTNGSYPILLGNNSRLYAGNYEAANLIIHPVSVAFSYPDSSATFTQALYAKRYQWLKRWIYTSNLSSRSARVRLLPLVGLNTWLPLSMPYREILEFLWSIFVFRISCSIWLGFNYVLNILWLCAAVSKDSNQLWWVWSIYITYNKTAANKLRRFSRGGESFDRRKFF